VAFPSAKATLWSFYIFRVAGGSDIKSCSIIPSGVGLEKTLALYQGMAFSHAAHC
jgi:hypothetical protein